MISLVLVFSGAPQLPGKKSIGIFKSCTGSFPMQFSTISGQAKPETHRQMDNYVGTKTCVCHFVIISKYRNTYIEFLHTENCFSEAPWRR